MKKSIILVLIFTLLLCACSAKETPAPAPAEPTAAPAEPTAEPAAEQTQEEAMYNSFIIASLDTEGKRVWSGAEAGIKEFRVPEAWTGAKGGIRAWYGFETNPGTGLARTDIVYIPSTEEAYDALIDELGALKASTEASEESFKKLDDAYINFQNGIAVLFSVIAVPNNGEPEKARELMLPGLMNSWLLSEEEAKARLETYTFIPVGTAEDYSFYLITSPLDVRNAFDGEKDSWKEEYDALRQGIAAYAENFTFARPAGMADLTNAGTAVRFETTDLEGTPSAAAVSSAATRRP